MINKIEVDKTVRIIGNTKSCFYGRIGKVWSKGNGDMWQVEVIAGCGVYFNEKELELIEG